MASATSRSSFEYSQVASRRGLLFDHENHSLTVCYRSLLVHIHHRFGLLRPQITNIHHRLGSLRSPVVDVHHRFGSLRLPIANVHNHIASFRSLMRNVLYRSFMTGPICSASKPHQLASKPPQSASETRPKHDK